MKITSESGRAEITRRFTIDTDHPIVGMTVLDGVEVNG